MVNSPEEHSRSGQHEVIRITERPVDDNIHLLTLQNNKRGRFISDNDPRGSGMHLHP